MNLNYNALDPGIQTGFNNDVGDVVGSPPTNSTLRTRTSWLASMLLLFCFLLAGNHAWSQVSGYSFVETTGSYTEITGGTLINTATGNSGAASMDSYASPAITLPFPFQFNGVTQTTAYMSSNGWMSLGATVPSAFTTTPISTASVVADGVVSPWAGDLNTFFDIASRTGTLRWETVGTAPNREIVFQWKDWRPTYTTSTTNVYGFSFQVRLAENGNKVSIVYGPGSFAIGSTAATGSSNRQIGLRGSSTADFNNRVWSNFSTPSTAGGANNAANSFSTATNFPASGLTLTWSPPTCVAPTGLTAATTSTTAANLSWTASTSAPSGGYEWEVRSSGAGGSGATGLATSGTTAAGVVSTSTSALTPGTAYILYVRSNCGAGDFSGWVASGSFTTPQIFPVPWTEGFATTALPAGWANTGWTIGSVRGVTGNPGNDIYKNLYSGATTGQFTTSNYGPVVAGQQFSVDYKLALYASPYAPPADGWGSFQIQVSSDLGATWTTLETISSSAVAGWTTKTYPLASYVGQNVSFRISATWLAGDYDLAFDNLTVAAPPTCFVPTALSASGVGSSTANISWTAASPAPSVGYVYEVRTSGAAGSGATGLFTSGSTASTALSLSGLSSVTAYTVYVRSDCSAGDYSNWASVPFTTTLAGDTCSDATVVTCGSNTATSLVGSTNESAAVCGISGVTTQNSAGIWFRFTGTGEDVTVSTAASATNVDTRLAVYSGTCGALTCLGGNDDIGGGSLRSEVLVSTTPGTEYYILLYSYSSTTPTAAINLTLTCVPACSPATTNDDCASAVSVAVGTPLDTNNTCSSPSAGTAYPSCGSSFGTYYDTWYTFNSGANTLLEITASAVSPTVVGYAIYSGTCGTLTQVACNTTGVAQNITLTAGTNYFIRAFSTATAARGSFTLSVKVPCLIATAVNVNGITTTGATINWTASASNPSNGYEYEIRTSGAAGSGATGLAASGTTAAGVVTATVNTLTLATVYTVYVRSSCFVGDFSPWSSAVTFATLCNPVTVFPWVETFESDSPTLACMKSVDGNTDGDAWIVSTTNPRTGTQCARLYTDFNSSNQDYLITPQLSIGTTAKRLKFWTRAQTTGEPDEISVKVSTTGNAIANFTSTVLASTVVNTTTYVEHIVNLDAFSGDIFIAFVRENDPADGYYLHVDDITVENIPASITSFAPTSTCSAGGETITITGMALSGATSVTFNGVAAQSFTVVNSTTITAVTPAGVTTGNIEVIAPMGTATSTSLTVNQNPAVGPITNGDVTLCAGETVDLDDATPAGTWSSSSPSVATVDSDGIVTTIAGGTTVISYTVNDGCVTTVTTTITVNDPIISNNPVAQTVVTGNNATYSVTATGSIVSYQWQVSTDGGTVFNDLADDATYSGVATNTLTISNAPAGLNGNYYQVVITAESPCAPFTTSPALLNVGDTGIATDPSNVTLCSTGAGVAVYTVVASGTVASYSWEEDQGLGFAPIADGTFAGITYAGSTTDQLTVSGLGFANSGWAYRAVVTGPANGATSNSASLTVNEGIVITSNPADLGVCTTGGSSVFTAGITGNASSYQWQYSANGVSFANVVNGTPAGATYTGNSTNQLTVATAASTPAATYYYKLIVDGVAPCGPVETVPATLNVNGPTLSITPPAATYCNPGTAVSLTASGAATYSWSPATGLSATTGSTVTASPATTTTYTVVATAANGCTATKTVVVTVSNASTATATASVPTVCSGSPVQLNAVGQQSYVTGPVASYAFAATTGVYTPVSAAATALPILVDFGISAVQTLPFTFNYGGVNYTQFKMASDGFISLSASATATGSNNLSTANAAIRPIIAPLWDDLDGNATGGSFAGYEVTGTAPNRVLTAEWRNWEWNYSSTAPAISFQAKLYEGSNNIEFVYRSESGSVASGSATIGIGAPTGSGSGSYLNVTNIATPAVSSTSSATSLSTKPATGTVYRFTPGNAPAFTYAWTSTPAGFTSSVANPIANPTVNTVYNVTVSSAAGCSGTASVSVGVESGAAITLQPVAVTKCQGESASFTVAATGPGLTYQWRKDGVNVTGNASATTPVLTFAAGLPTDSGSYDVVVTPACGAAATSAAVAFLVNPTPTATIPTAPQYCAGAVTAAIPLVGTPGGVTFDISGGASIGLADQTGVTAIPSFTSTTGSATITVTPKANGCTGTPVVFPYVINGLPTAVAVTPASAENCITGSPVALTATGGLSTSTAFTEGANALPTTFTVVNTAGTGSATLNTTYYKEGNGAVLFTTASTSANVQYAMNSNVSLSGAASAQVTFSHIVAMEGTTYSYDIGYVEYSTNGGSTWTTFPTSSYAGAGTLITTQGTSTAVSGVIFSNKSYSDWNTQFTGAASTPGTGPATALWKNETINVPAAALASAQFRIRFKYTTDSSANFFGWLIDNIRITKVSPTPPTWSPIAGLYSDAAGTVDYVANTPAATVYARPTTTSSYVARATSAAGCFVDSNVATITVSAQTVAGSVAGGTTVSSGSTSGLLTLSGHVGNIVRWESSVSPFSTWSPIANTAATYTSGALSQTTQFRAVVQSGACSQLTSAFTTVTVNAISFTSATSTAPVCLNTEATVTLNGLVANSTSSVSYTKSGVAQTPVVVIANASGVGTFPVLVTAAGQNVVITSIVRTDATPNSTLNPTSNNSVTFVVSTACTGVQPTQCGITLSAIDSYVYANLVSGAQGYRWRVTTLNGPNATQVQSITTSLRNLKLTQLGSYAFNTQYQVEVSVMKNNVWGPYATPCTVTTPTPVTQLMTCGQTLTSISDVIYANSVTFVSGYRFRITDPTNPLMVQVLDRALREFRMNLITDFAVQYGKTYNVEVAIKNTDGTYLPYSSVCTVTTPLFPTTSLEDAQCNDYAAPTMNTPIYASSYPGAISYVFNLTGPGLPAAGSEVVKPLRAFKLGDFTGLVSGATYNVRVRLIFNEADLPGPYGKTCTVIVPAPARTAAAEFSAVAYPNPFAENFNIDVKTSAEANVDVKVYDMTGRLLESHSVHVSEMESLKVGDRYPSGVYNVVVSQGDEVKTLRVIKR